MEDQVKQLLSLGKSGILVSWVIQGQINRLCVVCDVMYIHVSFCLASALCANASASASAIANASNGAKCHC